MTLSKLANYTFPDDLPDLLDLATVEWSEEAAQHEMLPEEHDGNTMTIEILPSLHQCTRLKATIMKDGPAHQYRSIRVKTYRWKRNTYLYVPPRTLRYWNQIHEWATRVSGAGKCMRWLDKYLGTDDLVCVVRCFERADGGLD